MGSGYIAIIGVYKAIIATCYARGVYTDFVVALALNLPYCQVTVMSSQFPIVWVLFFLSVRGCVGQNGWY